METPNPVQYAWIFQAYLRQVDAIAQRIEVSISHWRKHKSVEGGNKTLSELDKLRNDMLGLMSSIEESWEETTNNDEWLHADGEKEKKLLARALRDSRSWGRALKKFDEFQEEEFMWRHCEEEATLRYREWENSINAPPNAATGTAPQQQQKCQLL